MIITGPITKLSETTKIVCACGCDELIEPFDSRHRPRKFKHGHSGSASFTKGQKAYNWQGGRFVTGRGYARILCKGHPKANENGYVNEHDVIMENIIRRNLNDNEVVHHINGIKDDNRLENLQLMTRSQHMTYHDKQRYPSMMLDNGKFKSKATTKANSQESSNGGLGL